MTSKIDAKHYNQNSILQKALAIDVLHYHKFKSEENILDIGCGDGEVTKLISMYGKATGIDLCQNMIEFAKENNSNNNTEYINCPILEFKKTQEYSLITAFNSIYWCGNLNKIFSKIYDLLEPNGKFLIITYPKESPYWIPIVDLLSTDKWKIWKDLSILKYWLTTDEYVNVIKCNNLKVIHCNSSIENIHYKNKNEYTNYLKGWLPLMFTHEFPIDDFLDDLVSSFWKTADSLNIEYKKVVLYGTK
ncbi:class I SAM-dependent DNA methyltransferase [Francisella philomiragia]|uniref:class I SAM-dependent DNA methyltransferase n=1 Tax=Francisella philomiragia TaxID=28110 RepID=UPI001904FD0C|nr:class I SAM-dependent methyltransferase [Francisella philomiragia]MBK2275881.1 class I SAM-dependent methyltransferase [Francisella philomiragia]